jgi:hypothetical protein
MAYEYIDLFQEMGIAPVEPKKIEKSGKVTKKTETKKPNASSKQVEVKVKLPVTVYLGYAEPYILKTEYFPGKSEITINEAHEYLSKELKSYPIGISSLQKGSGNVLYLTHKSTYMVEKATMHLYKDTKLLLGDFSIDLSVIKTSEECNVECEVLKKLFVEMFPDYGSVGFIHSAINNVIVPTFSYPQLTQAISFPVSIGIFGRQELTITRDDYISFATKLAPISKSTVNEDDTDEEEDEAREDENESNEVNADEIESDIAAKKGRSETNTILAEKDILEKMVVSMYPDFSEGHLELQWNENSKIVIAKMVESKEKKKSNMPEETFPTDAMLSLVYTKFRLSPQLFGGKERVSKEELRKYVEKDRPEYSSERTNITYDKNSNYIIMVCTGSRKGADLVSEDDLVMQKISADEDVLFDWYKDGSLYRVEKTEVCCIVAPKPNPNIGTFRLLIPKVPMGMFRIAEDLFKRVYSQYGTEAMMQLFWDGNREEYFWYVPEQSVNPSGCIVKRDFKIEVSYQLVGDFHSHGHHDAFFSPTDNEDEKGFRIFGVYGNFDRQHHSFELRAGTGGIFVDLDISDVFNINDDSIIDEKRILKDLYHDANNRIIIY